MPETAILASLHLGRDVTIDFFCPPNLPAAGANLLLVNDGQNMEEMSLEGILKELYSGGLIEPVLCAAIHTGKDRKMEYGVSSQPDYLGRGARAGLYTAFILEELLPYIRQRYQLASFKEKAFAGFSLGALSALDIAWTHAGVFTKLGLFSGSFWWRSIDQTEKEYDDNKHRIMHQLIRKGNYQPGLKFFFQCGNMDETMDRNNNGIIDSIDDTLDVIHELVQKGYDRERDIRYIEMPDGRHDIPTWARVMPEFLKWGWGK